MLQNIKLMRSRPANHNMTIESNVGKGRNLNSAKIRKSYCVNRSLFSIAGHEHENEISDTFDKVQRFLLAYF